MNNNMNNLYDAFENYNTLGVIRPIKDGEFICEDVCPDCGHPLIPVSTSMTTLDMLEQTAHCDHCNKDFIECFTLHFIGYKEDITYEEN